MRLCGGSRASLSMMVKKEFSTALFILFLVTWNVMIVNMKYEENILNQ